MSLAEIERFTADLNSNEALRGEAGKHAAARPDETLIARAVSFAGSKGYAFTAEEAKEHIRRAARAVGRELGDAELDYIAGGTQDNPTQSPISKPIALLFVNPFELLFVPPVLDQSKPGS